MTVRPIAGSYRAAASDLFLEMLLQPGHQLDKVAGAEAVVELVHEDALPGVAAGAGRARQGEEISAAGDVHDSILSVFNPDRRIPSGRLCSAGLF